MRKAIVVVIAALLAASCSSGPSAEEEALAYATSACLAMKIGGDSLANFQTELNRFYSKREDAARAESLDDSWSNLYDSLVVLNRDWAVMVSAWEATAPSGDFEEFLKANDRNREVTGTVFQGSGLAWDAECQRVADQNLLAQEDEVASTERISQFESAFTVIGAIISLALYGVVVWFVYWMAGRKRRNQTTYLVLAIFFPLIMLIAVLIQKKLPEPSANVNDPPVESAEVEETGQ